MRNQDGADQSDIFGKVHSEKRQRDKNQKRVPHQIFLRTVGNLTKLHQFPDLKKENRYLTSNHCQRNHTIISFSFCRPDPLLSQGTFVSIISLTTLRKASELNLDCQSPKAKVTTSVKSTIHIKTEGKEEDKKKQIKKELEKES